MRWKLKNGREVLHRDTAYRIKWDKKAPSKFAQEVKDFLKKHSSHAIWFEEYRLPCSLLRVDFLSPTYKAAIEVHGRQHFEYVQHFFKNRAAFGAQIKRDINKLEFLQRNGYKVIELSEDDEISVEFFEKNFDINF